MFGIRTIASIIALSLLGLACSSTPAARSPSSAAKSSVSPIASPTLPNPPAKGAGRGELAIDASIREACGISDAEAYFAYDSAALDPAHRSVLRKLANCFSAGPLRGRSMLLVGHADPRGDHSYNLALGGSRADSVKSMLMSEGLAENITKTSSRGEMDARGVNESSWARDRRVDIMLMD